MSCASSVRKYHLTEIHTNCLIFSLPERVEWESYKLSFLFICLNEINDLCGCNIPGIAHLAFPSKTHITLTRIIYICPPLLLLPPRPLPLPPLPAMHCYGDQRREELKYLGAAGANKMNVNI